jgi:hypothetical protein
MKVQIQFMSDKFLRAFLVVVVVLAPKAAFADSGGQVRSVKLT